MPVYEHADIELVKALQKGDIDAFNQLYNKYNLKLFYFIRGYIGSKEDAEELIQEIFITIWEKRCRLKEYLSFNSYIFTVSYNAILKYYRNKGIRQKHMSLYLRDIDTKSNRTLKEIEYESLLSLIDSIITRLPPKRQKVFRLSREKGLSNKEIAEQFNLSIRTVEAQIHQAIKFIKKNLEKEGLIALLFFLFFY